LKLAVVTVASLASFTLESVVVTVTSSASFALEWTVVIVTYFLSLEMALELMVLVPTFLALTFSFSVSSTVEVQLHSLQHKLSQSQLQCWQQLQPLRALALVAAEHISIIKLEMNVTATQSVTQ
jgi:hypothetical protein